MELATFRYVDGAWSCPFPGTDSDRTLLIAFGAPGYADSPEPLRHLAQAFPRSAVIGCSTSGEIDGTRLHDGSIAVAALRFARTGVRRARAAVRDASESYAAGAAIAEQLRDDDLRAVLVLSVGLDVNGTALVRGIDSGVPTGVVVTGGLAGDGDRFRRTWVFDGATIDTRGVVAIGLYGDHVRVGHGSKGGWDTFGPERVVTESKGNVLYRLDGRPALALYKEYLGERATGLPGSALLFPLALRASANDGNSVVRTVLGVDEASQSMVFAGDVPTGHYAKLMKANFDRLILGAQGAAGSASFARDDGSPGLSIAISCVGRRLVLGARTEEEIEATLDALPPNTTQLGFYSYGEISPHTSGRCDLHNQTMTLTVISEAT